MRAGSLALDRLLQLGDFFLDLGHDIRRLRPVEADRGCARADLVRAEERGQGLGHSAQHRALLAGVLLLAGLDLLPLFEDLARCRDAFRRAEDVRMASDELRRDLAQRIAHREAPIVGLELGQEDALEEQIADLAAQRVVIRAVDGVEDFVGFLEHERPQGLYRLLAVPRASAGSTEAPHDVDQPLKLAPRRRSVRGGAVLRCDACRDADVACASVTRCGAGLPWP